MPNLQQNIDSALNPTQPKYSQITPTLFRERHGWCPYSERAWLAVESKNIPYDTIRIDNTGPGVKPPYYRGTTPQMRWEDGKTQGESMDLIQVLDEKTYPAPALEPGFLYPSTLDVPSKIQKWRDIFPNGARPSSRAAFLFSWNGEPLSKSEFERVLSETNDLLSTNSKEGPFFCGAQFTAADIAWAPFLERYAAQLPCLHDDLLPNNPNDYPYLHQWYEAMQTVPAYACRVKGNNASWRKVLGMAGFGNMGSVPSLIKNRMTEYEEVESLTLFLTEEEEEQERSLWKEYQSVGRDFIAPEGPGVEAAAILIRNYEGILKDISKRVKFERQWKDILPHDNEKRMENSLLGLAYLLMEEGKAPSKKDVIVGVQDELNGELLHDIGAMAAFLDDRMCVPRDMGEMSAAAIKRIAARLG